jgi:two-component system response regulator PilR (NtrC family)
MVRERRFREDLFYRLNVIPVRIPSLRERREDIPLLAEHFLAQFSSEMGKRVASISSEAMGRLVRYAWPGNVRELENAIERAVALETTPSILVERLPEPLQSPKVTGAFSSVLDSGFSLDAHLLAIERDLLREALTRAGGGRGEAARLLGVSPRSMRYLLAKHKVEAAPDKN